MPAPERTKIVAKWQANFAKGALVSLLAAACASIAAANTHAAEMNPSSVGIAEPGGYEIASIAARFQRLADCSKSRTAEDSTRFAGIDRLAPPAGDR